MRKRFVLGLLAAAIVLVLAAANRHELLRSAIQEGASLATGYAVTIGEVHVGSGGAAFFDAHVRIGGEALLDVKRVSLRYSLRDVLPGSRRRFGLVSVDLVDPTITLTRRADGSFNLMKMPKSLSVPGPSRADPVALRFSLRVRGAHLVLLEPAAFDVSAKQIDAEKISADAEVDTAGLTRYRLHGAFAERPREAFTVAGRIDTAAGYAMHHARAPYFPLRSLANYFADTREVRVLAATANNFDARLYALGVAPNVSPSYHVSLAVDVTRGRLALRALSAPIEDVRARLEVVDDAFYVRGARAMLAGTPLRIDGGAYDFTGAVTGGAQLRLGVEGTGDLSGLRRAFDFARDQPISGNAHLGVLVGGSIGDPVIVARVDARRAQYRAMPFEDLYAGVVYHANVVALAPLNVRYGGIGLGVRGTLLIGPHVQSLFALHVAGPARRLAYLDEMLGDEPIVVDAAATGRDFLFHVIGSAASARGTSRVAALVEMNPDGTASVNPFWLHTERGNLDGAYLLDRPHDTSAFWLSANGLRLQAPPYSAFPGLTLPQMPPIDGRTIGMTVAGGGSGNDVVLGGTLRGANTTIAGVPFDRIDATFGGTLTSIAMNALRATGPWGTFSGDGDFSGRQFVARGAYRGTFEGLQPFLGSAIGGHGSLAGSVAVAVQPQRIVVQGTDLAMERATLRGVPLSHASLTLAIEGNRLRVYSAHARAADGEVVAAGTYSLAPHPSANAPVDRLGLVAERMHADQLRGIGLPLESGILSATGNLAAGAPLPQFDGGVTVNAGRVAGYSIAGEGGVHLAGDAVALHRVIGAFGAANVLLEGRISGISSSVPAYALDANIAASPLARTMRDLRLPTYMTDGSFNATLHVAGATTRPTISGSVAVPAGEVNGLPFIEGSALLSADPSGASVRDGSVLVGTTLTHFSAVARPKHEAIAVSATHAQLADFNNFFDTGDTLAGGGRVEFVAATQGNRITSSGDLDVKGFRYRNLPIGDTDADWSSSRNVIRGAFAVGGSHGMLSARGSIALAPGADWQATLTHSRFDVTAAMRDLDLWQWLPALGMQSVPVTGRASGDATVRGRYPFLDARANARITDGTLGPLTLDSAQMAIHAAGRRVVIDHAQMTTPELVASAAGSVGLGRDEPLDVNVHATTDDVAKLAYVVGRVRIPVSGSFESTLKVGGTYRSPVLTAGFDATKVRAYGITVASLFGEVRLHRRALVLSNAGATFDRGELSLAGSLPLSLAPLRLASPDQPVSFDVQAVGLDPSIFDAMLGNDTKLGGLIDGHVGLSGTIRQPLVVGRLALAHGSYVSAVERVPITQLAAALSFNRTEASIQSAGGRFGNGVASLSGRVDFPNGLSREGTTMRFVGAARGAQLDLPAYGAGALDANVTLEKQPASIARLSGNVTLDNATLSFASFIRAATQSQAAALPPIPLALDLRARAGKNVRVRGNSYGAGLDIGASGSVQLAGTLAAPTLSGTVNSTGGTLTYFDRAFRVREGAVHFNAADGVVPTLHAVAGSSVVNPDPDRARNPYGSAEITISVDGPIDGLKIGLTSNPPGYTRDEILALLAPFGGFVNGIGFSRQSMFAPLQPTGITPLGALSPIPNVNLQQRSTITVGQEAFNILNAQFAAGLLAPLENTLGQGLGLSSINLTLGYYGNVGFRATRLLGKAVSAVYAITFGLPQIQSFGLVVAPNALTTATLNFFYQSGPTRLLQLPTSPVGYNAGYLVGQPLIGNSGFSLTFQRYF